MVSHPTPSLSPSNRRGSVAPRHSTIDPISHLRGIDPGHSCMAVVGPVERSITVETRVADREANMWIFAKAALELLEKCIRESG